VALAYITNRLWTAVGQFPVSAFTWGYRKVSPDGSGSVSIFGQSMLNYEVIENSQSLLKVACRSLPSAVYGTTKYASRPFDFKP
jgi:hypothetical protein